MPGDVDKRRQPYVAIDVWFLFGNTNDRLLSKFGPAGPLAWLGLIAAAKRAPVQGTLSYVNEQDFWSQIGLPQEHLNGMTMDALLGELGKLKQTSRSGRGTHKRDVLNGIKTTPGRGGNVRITRFEQWQQIPRSFAEANRKRRKRAESTADVTAPIQRRYSADSADDSATERRGEDSISVPMGEAETTDSNGVVYAEGYDAACAWVAENASLPPGKIAAHLIRTWPELDDHEIERLLKDAVAA